MVSTLWLKVWWIDALIASLQHMCKKDGLNGDTVPLPAWAGGT